MPPLRRLRPPRALGAVLALALFLAGTNLCLVTSLAGALGLRVPMSCMASAPAARGHCCATPHAAPSGGARPAAAPESPCCLALLPVSAPDADAPASTPSMALALAAPAPDATPALALTRAPALDLSDPPGTPPPSPRLARGPPLL